jgi:hypothetical protein
MKTQVLAVLETRLKLINGNVDNYEGSLKIALQNRQHYNDDSIQTLRDRLSKFNHQKRELLDCIDWVKSIEKKDLSTHRNKVKDGFMPK